LYPVYKKMMLRNKKVIERPTSTNTNRMSHFIMAFGLCVFCNLLMYSSPNLHRRPSIVLNVSNASADLSLKAAPKPGMYVFSSNNTFSDRVKNAWPFLERQYLLTDSVPNRTVALGDFAKKVAFVANNEKNVMVSVHEFISGRALPTVAFYNRPVLDFVEVNLLW
jgi:hypothetical protein